MAGVQKLRLNNLNININNALIVGIIISKNSPKIFGSKKKTGEMRGVTTFTLRDSEVDTINVIAWGTEYFVNTFYERFLVGDVVEISSPKICLKTGQDEMFKPHVSSPFYLSLNEGQSDVCTHRGNDFGLYLPLLHIPTKPSSGYYGLAEVLKLPEESTNVYVDLLVVVKNVKPVKTIKTKSGVDMHVRNVEIIDNTTPASLSFDIFDIDTIQRAEEWRPLESVLFIADARVSWRGKAVSVQVCSRTLITHQPHTADAESLRLYTRNQANTKGGEAAAWAAWSGERPCAASVAQIKDRLSAGAPFCASLHAVLTYFDLDDVLNPMNIQNEEIRVRFADHTGELGAKIPFNILEETMGCSIEQLKSSSADDRLALRWKILLEQCYAKVAASPPRLIVLALRRATPADPIPLKVRDLFPWYGNIMVDKQDKNELIYEYTKRRREFGKQCLFEDTAPELTVSIPSNPAMYSSFILRNPIHVSIQNAGTMSEHWVNSVRAEYTSSGMNHVEGGWPKDINMNDPEATQRYRRKIEKDDAYIHAVMHLGHSMEHNILQNNAIDMYQTYYSELPSIPPVERSSCHTVNVYREPGGGARRPVRALSWQADGGARLASAHADVDIMRSSTNTQLSYIWDIENANAPELIIKPPQPLLDLQYNPREQHTLVGGLLNGQVAFWDTRRGGEPTTVCPPHVAHRDLVRNVLFINSKTGAEFFSASPDGVVKWWDTRNMNEPTDQMIIDLVKAPTDTQSVDNALGISALEYEPTIPTRFMVGTETGLIIGGNRKGKNPVEKLPCKYEAHLGPVYALQRNPTFLKNFLTVGDWSARVWSEDCKESSILWTYSHKTKLTDGAWNPIRFSLMLVTQWDGCLSCWDLLRRRSAPIVTAQLCDEPLLRLRPHEGGLLVACGSSKGTIYLAELSQNLGTADKNDKQLLTHILDRENKRERILEARMREMRLKLRQEGPAGALPADTEHSHADRDLLEATQDYMHTVAEFANEQHNTI